MNLKMLTKELCPLSILTGKHHKSKHTLIVQRRLERDGENEPSARGCEPAAAGASPPAALGACLGVPLPRRLIRHDFFSLLKKKVITLRVLCCSLVS